MRRIHHRTSTSPDRVPGRRRIAAAGTGQRRTPVMRTLIARAAALAAATAAVAIPAAAAATTGPVPSWAPATAGGYSFGTLRAHARRLVNASN